MKKIDDERIKFYLKHRQQIEEWAKAGQEVPVFAHEFYTSLLDYIRERVPECVGNIEGDIPDVQPWGHGKEAAIRLRRCCWPAGPVIELGWHNAGRYGADFSRDQEVWCGICIQELEVEKEKAYFDQLSRAGNLSGLAEEYPESDSNYGYPMYKLIDPPPDNFWEGDNLEEYGNYVIKVVLKAWSDLAPLVDEAVKSHNQ